MTRFLHALLLAALLLAAPAARADDTALRFRAGMEAVTAAQAATTPEAREEKLDEAIAAFRSLLVSHPELVRVRLELARAFFLKGEDSLAKRHFEEALAGDMPAAAAANVQRFLRIIRARRRWEARFGVALAPDSNLNSASGNRTIWLDTPFGRLPFMQGRDSAPESGVGVSVWGGGEYQYPLSPRWRLRAGADASARDYRNRPFDRHFASVHLGPRWLVDARTEASLLATVQRQWTAGMPETDEAGLRLEAGRRLTPRLYLQGRAGLRQRDCRDCDWLDGPVGEAAVGLNWVALPTLHVGGNAGWRWSRAKLEPWRSAGPEASLGATLDLPLGFTLGARAAMHWTDYEGEGFAHNTIDRKPRRDRTRTLSLSLHNRAVTVFGFSPRLSLVNEKRETNAQLLDYERNRGELSFVRQF